MEGFFGLICVALLATYCAASPVCYFSRVSFVDDCDSPEICVAAPELNSKQCQLSSFSGEGHFPYFSSSSFSCRLHVRAKKGCVKAPVPTHMLGDDMVLSEEQWQIKNSNARASSFQWINKWPLVGDKYVVPYVIGDPSDWTADEMDALLWSMRWTELNSAIRFRQRSNEENYIELLESGGCWSQIGMTFGAQTVGLHHGCRKRHEMTHELFHALGLGHEHMRPDRDEFLTIHEANIEEGKEGNFDVDIFYSTHKAYDYASIMHYSSKSFNRPGTITMEPKLDVPLEIMDARQSSPNGCDFETINELYPGQPTTIPCVTNTIYSMCRPTVSCPDTNCQARCEQFCDRNLSNGWCQLNLSTEQLTNMVAKMDSPATTAPPTTPPPTIPASGVVLPPFAGIDLIPPGDGNEGSGDGGYDPDNSDNESAIIPGSDSDSGDSDDVGIKGIKGKQSFRH